MLWKGGIFLRSMEEGNCECIYYKIEWLAYAGYITV